MGRVGSECGGGGRALVPRLLVVAGILDVPWGVEASPLHLSVVFSPWVHLSLCLSFSFSQDTSRLDEGPS